MTEYEQTYPRYSTDVWDYLVDMPYLPSRQDRDKLVEASEKDNDALRRVRLWDYFFAINPKEVGKPHKQEITQLKDLIKTEEKLQKKYARKRIWSRVISIVLFVVAVIFIIIPLINTISPSVNQAGIPSSASNDTDTSIILQWWSLCCFSLSIPLFGSSIWLFFSSTKQRIKRQINRQIVKSLDSIWQKMESSPLAVEPNEASRQKQLGAYKDNIDVEVKLIKQRIQFLENALNYLNNQIPNLPSSEEVENWLNEDIQRLTQEAISRSGLQDRLIKVAKAENPFCIYGPAELQNDELIPPPFLKRNSDRHKHLHARKFVTMTDGFFADFYGVYNIGFILLAKDTIGTYATFFDFIAGSSSGEKSRVQHYADVVGVESLRGYREVEQNNTVVSLENVPSLSLSLTSSEKIEITFPDDEYFEQAKAEGFKSSRKKYNPQKAADNAIRATREKVNEAKRKLQHGS